MSHGAHYNTLMRRSSWAVAGAVCLIFAGALVRLSGSQPQAAAIPNGWTLPENAREEKNPLSATPAVLKKGKAVFESKCQRCHGPQGTGDGPDGDPEHKPADLTDASRASRNPDGVMFYKIWNGRKDPKMPAFKTDLPRDDVWAVVEYAKTLRKAQ
jgi:mono/diheme cytochrome c family protein